MCWCKEVCTALARGHGRLRTDFLRGNAQAALPLTLVGGRSYGRSREGDLNPAPGSHRNERVGRRRRTLGWVVRLAREGPLLALEYRGTQRREVQARTERPRSVTVAGWPPRPVRESNHEEVRAQEGNGRSRRHEKWPSIGPIGVRKKALKTEKAESRLS